MASMYKQFGTSKQLEQKGIILDYDDFRITIARAGGSNIKFAKALERHSKPHRRALDTNTMDETRARKMLYTVYAETIILDWCVKQETEEGKEPEYAQGIEGVDGSLLPFKKQYIIDAFTALHDLFLDVQEQAKQASLFRDEDLEQDAKN